MSWIKKRATPSPVSNTTAGVPGVPLYNTNQPAQVINYDFLFNSIIFVVILLSVNFFISKGSLQNGPRFLLY